ncbi:tyrosine-type recombinase/integrase [Rhodopseudomonas palustris]|uniref:tyrosine-type recombinase/integrase n=1 Tax=Rhodopseudomonas palustris TaxID=1076 RepID=UPI0021F31104|nr:site-specific integrase [Rhodopseudomonas palustris]UYO52482.1 site-specific integrase [Rhodopseudomonas palustris]
MATYAKGNKFITKFMVDGKRHTKMHDTKEEGEAWELQARAALKLGKPMPEQPTRVGGVDTGTMQNVLRSATTLHWNQLRRGGQKSVMNAGIFVDWVGPKTSPTDAFKQDKIRDFIRYLLEERGCSPITVNKYISAISILAKFSDVKGVKLPWFKPKEDRARKRYFTPEDEAEVVELMHRWGRERERDFFMFLNDTGLRPWAEAVPLTWDRCRADRVVDIVGKSGKLRDVPLTKRAALILARQPRGLSGPWTGLHAKAMSELWDRVVACIPRLDGVGPNRTVWYTCRHTFASRLVQAGEGYGHIGKLMDNSPAMIEKVYGHLDPKHLRDALNSLERYGNGTHLSLVSSS